jgi:DNA-directed RNA polymerase, mitochondrial
MTAQARRTATEEAPAGRDPTPAERRELALEHEAIEMGRARYERARPRPGPIEPAKRGEADSRPGRWLIERTLETFAARIREMIRRRDSGRGGAGNPTRVTTLIEPFDPRVAAFIAARRIVNGAAVHADASSVANGIARDLLDHYLFERMRRDPATRKLYRAKKERMDRRTGNEEWRRKELRGVAADSGVDGLAWSKKDRALVGGALLRWFIESTGYVQIMELGKREHLRFAGPVQAELNRQHEAHSRLAPVRLPMIVPPREWSAPTGGGYLSIRAALTDSLRNRELADAKMSAVYGAVNAIQATRWRINRDVLAVADEVQQRGIAIRKSKSFPGDDLPIPPRPYSYREIPRGADIRDLPPEQAGRLKRWKKEAREAHTENANRAERRRVTARQLKMAEKFADEPVVYFPHSLDFRGRVYPMPQDVTPQADDLGRALLQFAAGKPLGQRGAYWLAVHLANCYGFDKAPFDERVAWTRRHSELILDSARRPLDGRMFWADKAEDPWQFLAACMEWAGYIREGDSYVSHIPASMDATCSGLQHFSALLLDEQGGAAVNLLPGKERRDIYQDVADRVSDEISASSEPEAKEWRGKVTRKITKQPTMTYAYSATPNGMRDQIVEALEDSGAIATERRFRVAHYLAPKVRQAIAETVVSAAGAMAWLQKASAVFSRNGIPIRWTAATGLPILQSYRPGHVLVRANIGGRYATLTLRDSIRQSTSDHRSGIAPNYIHSMDAAHLMHTTLALREAGIEAMAMVHDSFGVHACDVDTMHRAIRDEFVRLYRADRLAILRDELAAQLPPELAAQLPPLPERGALDIEQVTKSEFFFS